MANNFFSRVFLSAQTPFRRQTSSNQLADQSDFKRRRSLSIKPISLIRRHRMTPSATMESGPMASVIIYSLPVWLNRQTIEEFINTFPEIERVQYSASRHTKQRFDMILDLAVGGNALLALETLCPSQTNNHPGQHKITLDHQVFMIYQLPTGFDVKNMKTASIVQYDSPSMAATVGIPRPKTLKLDNLDLHKPECSICRDELDGPFSTPCWGCQCAECYACLERHFLGALKDFEQFPAQCCGTAFHPDVGRALLSKDDYARYKSRFEEWLTAKPIYCPIPTCSAFIPPRLIRLLDDNTFRCHTCDVPICASCKSEAHIGQSCTEKDQNSQAVNIIKKFGYKRCPRCGTAVGKMFGCSHLQCTCGAHWCWECGRRIEICNMYPCDQAQEGDFDDEYQAESDIENDADPEDEAEPQPQSTNSMVSTQIQHSASTTGQNLGHSEGAHMTDFVASVDTLSHPVASASISNEIVMVSPVQNDSSSSDSMLTEPPPDTAQRSFQHHEHQATAENENNHSASQQVGQAVPIDAAMSMEAVENTDVNTSDSNSTTTTVSEINAASATTTPELTNLDDPNAKAWDHEDVFFGNEPVDEDSLDVWGCIHWFETVTLKNIPRYWMTASVPDGWERDFTQQEVECMICFSVTRMASGSNIAATDVDNNVNVRDWRFARHCTKCGIFVCRKCKNQLTKAGRTNGSMAIKTA